MRIPGLILAPTLITKFRSQGLYDDMAMLAPYCCPSTLTTHMGMHTKWTHDAETRTPSMITYPKPITHVHDLDVASPFNQNSCHKKHIVKKCLRERLELNAESTRLLLLCLCCSKHVIPTCRGNFTV
jgi:hypothetical protein